MTETTHPYGYATTMLDLAELKRRTLPHMLPAMAERLFPWIESTGLDIRVATAGCGGGRRTVQPNKPGFAKPVLVDGVWVQTTFHMLQTFEDGNDYYSAWDLVVVDPGGRHRSPTWAEVESARDYGLHCFISGEPWHIQCIEIRGWRSWINAGRKLPRMGYTLPTGPSAPVELPPGAADYAPPANWWLFPLDSNKPDLVEGTTDGAFIGHRRYAQDVLNLTGADLLVDGEFGPLTAAAVAAFQLDVGLVPDRIVGPLTWAALDAVVAASLVVAPDNGPEAATPCKYAIQSGDSPWRLGERLYDNWRTGVANFPPELFYAPAGTLIDTPAIAGLSIVVEPDEGPFAILGRMGRRRDELDTFYLWNGGRSRMLHAGEVVYMPTTAVRP